MSLLASEKAKKNGNTTKKDPYDDPYWRSDSEVDSDEEDDDDDSCPSYFFLVLPIQFLMGKMFVSSWRILWRRTICGILVVRHRAFV